MLFIIQNVRLDVRMSPLGLKIYGSKLIVKEKQMKITNMHLAFYNIITTYNIIITNCNIIMTNIITIYNIITYFTMQLVTYGEFYLVVRKKTHSFCYR